MSDSKELLSQLAKVKISIFRQTQDFCFHFCQFQPKRNGQIYHRRQNNRSHKINHQQAERWDQKLSENLREEDAQRKQEGDPRRKDKRARRNNNWAGSQNKGDEGRKQTSPSTTILNKGNFQDDWNRSLSSISSGRCRVYHSVQLTFVHLMGILDLNQYKE
jgi:hypothetical protein